MAGLRLRPILIATAFIVAGCRASSIGVPNGTNGLASGPQYMLTRSAARAAVAYNLLYNGGPVLERPRLYLIFWGWHKGGDPDKVKPLLLHYAESIGGSGHNNIYTQYYGPSGHIKNPAHQLGRAFDDSASVPAHPTKDQIAGEAARFIKMFGFDKNGAYVVATPHGHNTPGFGTQFCGFHDTTTYKGQTVPYIGLSYMPDAGANCGAGFITPPPDESAADEGVTIVLGAQYGDTITDPDPPTGWDGGGEISNACAWADIQNDPFGQHSYTTQPMFSNASQSCVQSYYK
jgi:hypothetical protein